MRRFVAFGPAFVVLLSAAVLLAVVPAAIKQIGAAQTRVTMTVAARALDSDDVLERMNNATRNLAKLVEPSVVHLDVVGRPMESSIWAGSSGSGWVYDNSGHIVTNAHVVSGARRINVQFSDGAIKDARIVGSDPFTDIAVLRVEPDEGQFPIRRATGSRPEKGDRVFAFGSPFGFKFSMAEGIVSGLGRNARGALGFAGATNYIQTDAAVNPGHSGGPLVDVRGRLIGMNVAIATAQGAQGTTEGQSAGISFAIPLAVIESRVPQLIASGKVEPAYLGIVYRNNSSRFVDIPDYRGPGVAVESVSRGDPADLAGMKAGDIILSMDDEQTIDADVLRTMISTRLPGQTVRIKIARDQELIELVVTLTSAPASVRAQQVDRAVQSVMGMAVTDSPAGVRISAVVPGSPAAQAGLQAGMQVQTVGGTRVESRDELLNQLSEKGLLTGSTVLLTVREPDAPDGQTRDIRLRMPRQ